MGVREDACSYVQIQRAGLKLFLSQFGPHIALLLFSVAQPKGNF